MLMRSGLGPSTGDRHRVRAILPGVLKPRGGRPTRGRVAGLRAGLRLGLALLAALALAAALVGCGSSDNGVASKSGKEILAASKAAAVSASSVHVVGKTSQGPASLSIDLRLTGDSGRGQISFLGADFEVIQIGATVYVKGTPIFYERLGDTLGLTLHVPKGTWMKGSASSGPLAQFVAFVDLRGELNRMLSTPGTVTKGQSTTVNGQKVIELKEATKVYKGSLYVATTGKPYPVKFVKNGGRERGLTSFSGWNEEVSVTAPSPVVDFSTLKG